MSIAYTKVLETYSKDADVTGDVTLDELRQSSFKELFVKELVKLLQNGENSNQYSINKLNGYLDMKDSSSQGQNKIDSNKGYRYNYSKQGKTLILFSVLYPFYFMHSTSLAVRKTVYLAFP